MIFHLLTEETLKERKFKAGMTMMERCATWYSEFCAVKGSSLPLTVQKFSFLKQLLSVIVMIIQGVFCI